MYQDRIVLTPENILEKEFKIDTRGYRLQEVDKFLDVVIKDYYEFNKIIEKLEEKVKSLTDENLHLNHELRNLKMSMESLKTSDKEITNVDVLRRLSQLEKIVYDKDIL